MGIPETVWVGGLGGVPSRISRVIFKVEISFGAFGAEEMFLGGLAWWAGWGLTPQLGLAVQPSLRDF